MMYDIIAIVGLVFVIIGTLMISEGKRVRREHIYPFLLLGSICLLIYSIHIKDKIFIVLKSAYLLIVIYDLAKLKRSKKHK